MTTIRLHGMGGQGVVTASEILAAAAFADGKFSQAQPFFGVERTGSPVEAYVRLDKRLIRTRAKISKPDYMIIIDQKIFKKVDFNNRIKKDCFVMINGTDKIKLAGNFKTTNVIYINAAKIANTLENPKLLNMALLGAWCQAYNLISLTSLEKTIKNFFKAKNTKLIRKNIQAAKAGAKLTHQYE